MNVLYVTLLAIAAPVAIIAIIGLPSQLCAKGRDAWRNIPRELYAAHPQRLLGLKISRFWYSSVVFSTAGEIFKWLGWNNSERMASNVSLALIVCALVYHFLWALRILLSRVNIDSRLVRFARYALLGSGTLLLMATAGLVADLTSK